LADAAHGPVRLLLPCGLRHVVRLHQDHQTSPAMNSVLRIASRTAVWVVVLVAGAAGIHMLTFSTSADGGDLDHQRNFNDGYKVFSLTLPNELSFCNEEVPLERLDVRERLDRELLVNTYWQSNTLLAHKRAARWFPLIEEVLRRNGVPDDMKYLALI